MNAASQELMYFLPVVALWLYVWCVTVSCEGSMVVLCCAFCPARMIVLVGW